MRLSALSLITAALALTACNAPSVSTLPVAPESASGYRTDLQARHASRHMAAAANPLAAAAGGKCCVVAVRPSMQRLQCKRC
jgi:gamma-glutamyltranspeptidase/glutathione hydrolase